MNSASPLPSVLSEEEQSALINQPDPLYPSDHRNLAMFMTLLNCGMYISELVSLQWVQFDEKNQSLQVTGDAPNQQRHFSLSERLLNVLSGWKDRQLSEWSKRQSADSDQTFPDTIFTKLDGTDLSVEFIRNRLQKDLENAGIERPLHPDTLRHSFAADLYEKTGDIHRVHRALGNENVFKTVQETRIPEDKLSEIERKLGASEHSQAEENELH